MPHLQIYGMDLFGPPHAEYPDLFHYQPFDPDWLMQTVVGKRLYLSNPGRFNDPWDCQPHFDSTAAHDPVKRERHIQYYIRTSRRHAPHISEAEIQRQAEALRADPASLQSRIDEFSRLFPAAIDKAWRLYCLSTKPDSELMWAHYAQQHKGVCLGFSSRNDLFRLAIKVNYVTDYPAFDVTDSSSAVAVLTIKSRAWEYEDEYRLIAQERQFAIPNPGALITDDSLLALPDHCLTSIIVGALASDSTLSTLKTVIARAHYPIALKRAVKAPSQYKLNIMPVS